MSAIVVTGLGIVSAAGLEVVAVEAALRSGRSGLGRLTRFDSPRCGALPVAEVALTTRGPRAVGLASAALTQALAQANLPTRDEVGLTVGCTVGGLPESEQEIAATLAGEPSTPEVWLRHECGATTSAIARAAGLRGPALTVSTACASGAQAIALGAELLLAGQASAVAAGGVDALCRLTLNGFASLLLVDPEGCRPFDAQRAGMSLGEGAAFLILEREADARARGADVVARLSGWATTCDAHHVTAPHPEGAGAAAALRAALVNAGRSLADVDYVNAHGTGTPDNDRAEARALATVFVNAPPPFSSTKRVFGHTLGASGAIEALATILALRGGFLPGTPGLATPDPALRLAPLRETRSAHPRVALSNAFGFGGTNTVLCLELPVSAALVLRSWAVADSAPDGDLLSDRCVALPPAGFHRRKARLPTLAVALAQHALGERTVSPHTAVLFGTARGCQTETIAFVEHMIQAGEATPKPRAFSASVHNAPAAQVAIALGAQGQNQTFVHGALSLLHAVFAAQRQPHPVLLGLVDERTAYDDLARGRCLNTPDADAPVREGGLALWLERATPLSGEVVLGSVAFARPRDPDAWLARHLADAPRSVVGGGDALAPGLALLRALPTLAHRHAIVVRSRFGDVGCLILERTP